MNIGSRVRYCGSWWPKLTDSLGTVIDIPVNADGFCWVTVEFDCDSIRLRITSENLKLWSPLHELAEAAG